MKKQKEEDLDIVRHIEFDPSKFVEDAEDERYRVQPHGTQYVYGPHRRQAQRQFIYNIIKAHSRSTSPGHQALQQIPLRGEMPDPPTMQHDVIINNLTQNAEPVIDDTSVSVSPKRAWEIDRSATRTFTYHYHKSNHDDILPTPAKCCRSSAHPDITPATATAPKCVSDSSSSDSGILPTNPIST